MYLTFISFSYMINYEKKNIKQKRKPGANVY